MYEADKAAGPDLLWGWGVGDGGGFGGVDGVDDVDGVGNLSRRHIDVGEIGEKILATMFSIFFIAWIIHRIELWE